MLIMNKKYTEIYILMAILIVILIIVYAEEFFKKPRIFPLKSVLLLGFSILMMGLISTKDVKE